MSSDQQPRPRRLKPSSRPLTGPAVVPEGGPLRELKQLLFDLYQDCGSPSYTSIAAAMAGRPGALGDTLVGQYLTEPALPPNQQSTMTLAAVIAGPRDPDDVRDQTRRLWVAAKNWTPPGRLISQLNDPLALEIHQAIDVAGSETLPVLPPYVERPHDLELRARLTAAVAQGRSTMVTLVGGSSTGKTRACWEAIHAEAGSRMIFDGWRLWHPFDPTKPEAALERLHEIGPRTVVWLNEAQDYLLTLGSDLGERVAARLRTMLDDPDRAPVVVLGTLWETYLNTLTHDTARPSPHSQARQLLDRTEIVVPPSFDPAAVAALRKATGTDPRLVEAALRAEDGELTQYLAGGPALLKHYETAPTPAAKALLTMSMDLRRLGHGPAIPKDVLEAGVPAYLTNREWRSLEDDWFDTALCYAQQLCRGAHQPLTRLRPRPGEPNFDRPHYRLADYLEESGRRTRAGEVPCVGFWDAAVEHARTGADRKALADSARVRGRYRQAALLLQRAAAEADGDAMVQIAELLQDTDRAEEAAPWWRLAADAGQPEAMEVVAQEAAHHGQTDEAATWWKRAAQVGHPRAAKELAYLLESADRTTEAFSWWRRAPGSTAARRVKDQLLREGRSEEAVAWLMAHPYSDPLQLADLLLERHRVDEAITVMRNATEESDPDSGLYPEMLRRTVRLMAGSGRAEEAIAWLRRLADKGYDEARRQGTDLLVAEGRTEEAIEWLKSVPVEFTRVAALLVAQDRPDEALSWLQDLADQGDVHALCAAAGLLLDRGLVEEAHAWLGAHRADDDTIPFRRVAALLRAEGRAGEALERLRDAAHYDSVVGMTRGGAFLCAGIGSDLAIREWESAASSGETLPMLGAAIILEATDSFETVLARSGASPSGAFDPGADWFQARAEAGDTIALVWAVRHLERAGRAGEVLGWLMPIAEGGDYRARAAVADLLQRAGRTEELLAFHLRAAEAGNSSAARTLAELLEAEGRIDEAAEWLQHSSHRDIPEAVAELFNRAGRVSEALTWWQRAADAGDRFALRRVASLLGHLDGERLRRYGWEPDGSIARSWSLTPPP